MFMDSSFRFSQLLVKQWKYFLIELLFHIDFIHCFFILYWRGVWIWGIWTLYIWFSTTVFDKIFRGFNWQLLHFLFFDFFFDSEFFRLFVILSLRFMRNHLMSLIFRVWIWLFHKFFWYSLRLAYNFVFEFLFFLEDIFLWNYIWLFLYIAFLFVVLSLHFTFNNIVFGIITLFWWREEGNIR